MNWNVTVSVRATSDESNGLMLYVGLASPNLSDVGFAETSDHTLGAVEIRERSRWRPAELISRNFFVYRLTQASGELESEILVRAFDDIGNMKTEVVNLDF